MTRAWCCGVLALMLSACSLPFSQPYWQQAEPTRNPASDRLELNDWLQLSAEMMRSSESERRQELQQLQNMSTKNQPANHQSINHQPINHQSANLQPADRELQLALWLSHPEAGINQRQQAQQLFKQHLPAVSTRVQQLLGAYQIYNQELLTLNRQLADRQQQIDSLTRKLKELASIDEQINERKFREQMP
ncbi:hypothetical protein HNR62_002413 [Oceanisphaera litoralis]|uniref:hypothetical protein n=1 Tax=Oceanisphaera litoralis TaxID=225144 RepID=UPI001958E743|nr:hypothetical protein [Oceanisphaera litoralis]MBM7456523.1 hypothetical protein [Oceanisphaera litoralis]